MNNETLKNNTMTDELFIRMLQEEIMVYEQVQGSKVFVNWNGMRWRFRAKHMNSNDLTLLDLTVQKYYNFIVDFFTTKDQHIKNILQKDWWFCFEYMYDEKPAFVKYDMTPTNHLVLTNIIKIDDWCQNPEEIETYAKIFNTDMLPILFFGRMSEQQAKAIRDFSNTSKEDLAYIFGTTSFSEFFYKVLCPNAGASYLMFSDSYNPNIEKMCIKFTKSAKLNDICVELLNPFYDKKTEQTDTDYLKIYSLMLINFSLFMQTIDLKEVDPEGDNREEIYIDLMSKLFSIYYYKFVNRSVDWDFKVPSFYKKEQFRLNTDMISDEICQTIVKTNDKNEYVFKVILNNFSRILKKPLGDMDERMLPLFNDSVKAINKYLDSIMDISELEDTNIFLLK